MLLTTTYAQEFIAAYLGTASAMPRIVDSTLVSGLINSTNVIPTPYTTTKGGLSIQRMPTFTVEEHTNTVNYSRAGFDLNVDSIVYAKGKRWRVSHASDNTHGILEDANRLNDVVSFYPNTSPVAEYLMNNFATQGVTVYNKYIENFTAMIFADHNKKVSYDTSTGDGGAALTFAADCPHTAALQATDIANATTTAAETGADLIAEIDNAIYPMYPYEMNSLYYILTPRSVFVQDRLVCQAYARQQGRRYVDDTAINGTCNYAGSAFFQIDDKIWVSMPDTGFPTSGTTSENFRRLILTTSAIAMGYCTQPMKAAQPFGGTGYSISTPEIAGAIRTIEANLSQAPDLNRRLSYVGVDQNVLSAMASNNLGTTALLNVLGSHMEKRQMSTGADTWHYYCEVAMDAGIIRKIPGAMREFTTPKALYTVTPEAPFMSQNAKKVM